MIFQRTWERFVSDWKTFAIMALGLLTGSLTVGVLMLILMMTAGWSTFYPLFMMDPQLAEDPQFGLSVIGLSFFTTAFIVLISIVGAAFVSGGLYGSVAAYRRGEPVSVGLYWRQAARHFRRMVGLIFLGSFIVVGVQLVGMLIPFFGFFLVLLITPGMNLYFLTYPAYLIVADGKGVPQALGQMFSLIGRAPKEAVLATLVYWLFALVMFALGLITIIPVLGPLAYYAGWLLAGPFFTYYAYERFETNLRSLM